VEERTIKKGKNIWEENRRKNNKRKKKKGEEGRLNKNKGRKE
jgi:hypothetical protein